MAQNHPFAGLAALRFVPVKNSNVVAFTKQYTKYYDSKGEPADRRDTEFYWAFEVRKVYEKGHPEFDRLLSQVNSPANEQFWAERMDPVGSQLRDQLQAPFKFRAFPREPTAVEAKTDPGLLILGDASQSFLLPGYYLKPVTAIDFSSFVITLLMKNPSLHFTYAMITALWSTLVLQVYHFERDDVKSAKMSEMHFHSGPPHPTAASTAVPTPTMTGFSGVEEQQRQRISVLEQQLRTLRGRVRN